MTCCKCEEFDWEDPQERIYTDSDGNDYCLFHAPAEEKGRSVEAFNERVFARIQAVIDSKDKEIWCDLSGTIFPGDISFYEFGKESPLPAISFESAAFSGDARFKSTAFSDEANFSSAAFSGYASLYSAAFSGNASFSSAAFSGYADFSFAAFSGKANFSSAAFSGNANFSSAAFSGKANFSYAAFSGNANFSSVAFSGNANFSSAAFSGEQAQFTSASFEKTVDFSNTQFLLPASDSPNAVRFVSNSFDQAVFSNATVDRPLLFDNCRIGDGKLRFYRMDLKWCNFLETGMERIEFIDSTWHATMKEQRPLGIGQKLTRLDRYKVPWEDNPRKTHLVRDFYQTMKRLSKDRHNEYEASKWHVAEKDALLRLLTQNGESRLHRLFLLAYKYSSGFGEMPGRAGVFLLLWIVAVWLLLGLGGVTDGARVIQGVELSGNGVQNFGTVFKVLFKNIMLMRDIGFEPVIGFIDGLVLVLTRLVVPFQFALFAMAVRNKMRR